jgi:hypothetical protein
MKKVILLLSFVVCGALLRAEEPSKRQLAMAVKTNLLYDAAAVPNLGIEVYLKKNWTIGTMVDFAWWGNGSYKRNWRYTGVEIEANKWFPGAKHLKPLTGHHLGVYANIFTYDFALNSHGYIGGRPAGNAFEKANYAFGVDYGYSVPLACRLNLDFNLGIGYWGGNYHEYRHIDKCYVWEGTSKRKWFGPTKAEITLSWLIGKGVTCSKGRRIR